MKPSAPAAPSDYFGPTIWTTILRAKDGQAEEAVQALGVLLERYYTPILRHVQHERRCSCEEATELTHDFVVHCQGREFLKRVEQGKGKFRDFIKACIANFLHDRYRTETTLKRAKGVRPASLDETDSEGKLLHDPAAAAVEPGLEFDRALAHQFWARTLAQLRRECAEALRSRLFDCLVGSLGVPDQKVPLSELAAQLGMSEGAVKVASHRLRKRLRELFKEEVRQTVASNEDCREELQYIISLLAGR